MSLDVLIGSRTKSPRTKSPRTISPWTKSPRIKSPQSKSPQTKIPLDKIPLDKIPLDKISRTRSPPDNIPHDPAKPACNNQGAHSCDSQGIGQGPVRVPVWAPVRLLVQGYWSEVAGPRLLYRSVYRLVYNLERTCFIACNGLQLKIQHAEYFTCNLLLADCHLIFKRFSPLI